MAQAAIRTIDEHTCPAHGVEKASPSSSLNVLTNSHPAIRVGDPFVCGGCGNRMATGASTVTVNGEFAGRAFSTSDHGGAVLFGSANVVIGGPTGLGCIGAGNKACEKAAAGRKSGSTHQTHENCALEVIRQIARQAKGHDISEDELLAYARKRGFDRNGQGGTFDDDQLQLLQELDIPAEYSPAGGNADLRTVKEAVTQRRGVLATVNPKHLWDDKKIDDRHAVLVTGVELDDKGNVTAVFINDTGVGTCSQRVPADRFNKSMYQQPLLVTKGAVW